MPRGLYDDVQTVERKTDWMITINTWVNGAPIEHARFVGFDQQEAEEVLHSIGRLKLYDGRMFCGRLHEGDVMRGVLDIHAPSQLSRVRWIHQELGLIVPCQCAACKSTIDALGLDNE